MAFTKLTDILADPNLRKRIGNAAFVESLAPRAAYRQAGLVGTSDALNAFANQDGSTVSVRYLNPLTGRSVRGSDDLSQHITPNKLTGGEIHAVRQLPNTAWEVAELASVLSGTDLVGAAVGYMSQYSADDEQERLAAAFAAAAGAVASNAGMTKVYDGRLDPKVLIDAAQTKGEKKGRMNIMVVHSAVHAELQKDNLFSYRPNSDQDIGFGNYNGYKLVVSDSIAPDSNGFYTSFLAAPNAIMVGEGDVARGRLAIQSSETAGNGSGGDTIIYRRNQIFSVAGFTWKLSANEDIDVGGPDYADLLNPANIQLVHDPKVVPLAFMKTKLANPAPVVEGEE